MTNYKELNEKYKNKIICGIDEVARGNVCGPLIVAGCILDMEHISSEAITVINDSKKTHSMANRAKRLSVVAPYIKDFWVVFMEPTYIDKVDIKHATIKAMEAIIRHFKDKCDIFMVDAEKPSNVGDFILESFNHADALSLNVAAASLIAKYSLDCFYATLVRYFPQWDNDYHFSEHSGYYTQKHKEAVETHGRILNFHRLSCKPITKTVRIYDELKQNDYEKIKSQTIWEINKILKA